MLALSYEVVYLYFAILSHCFIVKFDHVMIFMLFLFLLLCVKHDGHHSVSQEMQSTSRVEF